MSRKVSLLILLGTVVAIGVLFFQVVQPFIFPLFFAAVLAVLFRPWHVWLKQHSFGHYRIAAALLTTGVLAVIMLPLGAALTLAGIQLVDAGKDIVAAVDLPENADETTRLFDLDRFPWLRSAADFVDQNLTQVDLKQVRQASSDALLNVTRSVYDRTRALAADAITFTIGLVVMVVALYYFFADGETMLREGRDLLPFATEDQQTLLDQFDNICRGVVLGTVVAGLIQGVLAGIGFAILGVERVWLLAVCSMLFSFIPFLGAAAIWICVTIALLFEQRYGAAGFLAVYGTVVISGSDNLVKAHIIHGRAQMHPLIALVTVLGALQLVGLWGIFLGPMTAAFFYALLKTLKKKLLEEKPEGANEESQEAADAA